MTRAERTKQLTHQAPISVGRKRYERLRRRTLVASVLAGFCLVPTVCADDALLAPVKHVAKSRASSAVPIAFEPNQGQWPSDIRFAGKWGPIWVAFTAESVVMTVPAGGSRDRSETEPRDQTAPTSLQERRERLARREVPAVTNVLMRFRGSNAAPPITGLDLLSGNGYYIAADGTNSRGAVHQYGRVEYHDLYPNVDLAFYVNQGRLEYDLVVRPGGDTSAIDLEFEGMDAMALSEEGDLVLQTPGGRLRHRQPKAFVGTGAKKDLVPTRVRLNGRRIGFEVTGHDRRKDLRIDPVIEWETPLNEEPYLSMAGLAVDPAGNSYVAGVRWGLPYQNDEYLVVSKFDAQGRLVYRTVLEAPSLPGSQPGDVVPTVWLNARRVSVDAAGAAHVVGTLWWGSWCGYLAKLSPDGSALAFPVVPIKAWNPANAGQQNADALGVAVDVNGIAYVVGESYDVDYMVDPDVPGFRYVGNFPQIGDLPFGRPANTILGGVFSTDAFLAAVDPNGQILQQGLFGGRYFDRATDVTVASSGAIYISGWTNSPDFPTTEGAYQRELADTDNPNSLPGDAFVLKLAPRARALSFSTLIGGSYVDIPLRVAVDRWGSSYLAGVTTSTDFPGIGVFPGGSVEYVAFLVKVNTRGSALRYSRLYSPTGEARTKATDVVVGGDGTSYWSVRTMSHSCTGMTFWLTTLEL